MRQALSTMAATSERAAFAPSGTSRMFALMGLGHLPDLQPALKAKKLYLVLDRLMKLGVPANEDTVQLKVPGQPPMLVTKDIALMRQVDLRIQDFVTPTPMADPFADYSAGLVGIHGPIWARHRKAAAKALQTENLRASLQATDEVMQRWLAASSGTVVFDTHTTFRALMLDVMGQSLFSRSLGGVNSLLPPSQRGVNNNGDAVDLLAAVDEAFKGLAERSASPKPLWFLAIPRDSNKRFLDAVALIRRTATRFVEEREAARGKVQGSSPQTGRKDFLDHLLGASVADGTDADSKGLTRDEVVDITMDVIAGSLDTTSHSLGWLMWALALDSAGKLDADNLGMRRHLEGGGPWYDTAWLSKLPPLMSDILTADGPRSSEPGRVWSKLREEVTRVVGSNLSDPITWEVVNGGKLPYCEAVIKETLRLFNVLASTGRMVDRAEGVTLDIPARTDASGAVVAPAAVLSLKKGAMVVNGHNALHTDERYFPQPHLFMPERWLKDSEGAEHDAGTSHSPAAGATPSKFPVSNPNPSGHFHAFGGGPKHCIGKRLAMVQSTAILARLVQAFDRIQIPEADVRAGKRAPEMVFQITATMKEPFAVEGVRSSGNSK